MKKYLLDTDICIFLLKDKYNLVDYTESIGLENCYVSEITIAELKFGSENSANPVRNRKIVNQFLEKFTILPIYNSLDIYAKEKARLRKQGTPLDDFDLLIASTAIANKLVLISNNTSDFIRISRIKLENWINKQ